MKPFYRWLSIGFISVVVAAFIAVISSIPTISQQIFIPPYGAGQIPATTTNDTACSTCVGYYLSPSDAALNSISMTSGAAVNVVSQAYSAGDWDLSCEFYFLPGATTTITYLTGSLSTTSATNNLTIGFHAGSGYGGAVIGSSVYTIHNVGPTRVSLSGSQTYYCVAVSVFGVSTLKVGGRLRGRKAR